MIVLVIDDDVTFSEPLLWRLKEEGYEVTYCKSVDEVLYENGELNVPRPDCIILDIMMPSGKRYNKRETNAGRETGLRLLEDIQKKEPNIPVIITTVHRHISIDELRNRFGEVIKEILVKPVTPSQVINEIKMHFPKTD